VVGNTYISETTPEYTRYYPGNRRGGIHILRTKRSTRSRSRKLGKETERRETTPITRKIPTIETGSTTRTRTTKTKTTEEETNTG